METVEDYINLGNDYLESDNYDEAYKAFSQAIQLDPTSEVAYTRRGDTLCEQGNSIEGITDYNQAIKLNPSYHRAYCCLGGLNASEGKLVEASNNLDRAVELDPQCTTALYNRGVVYYKRGHLYKALISLTQVIKIDPNYADAFNSRGLIYYKKKNFDESLINYNHAIELEADKALFYYNRGRTHHDFGNLTEALSDFSQAIRLKPDYYESYNLRGILYRETGQLDNATADYSRAIELDPSFMAPYENRARIYYHLGHLDKAFEDLNQAIKLEPHSAELYHKRAKVFYDMRKFLESLKDYNSAIYRNSSNAMYYFNRGNLFDVTNSFTNAISDYNKAIKLDPYYGKPYGRRGAIYFKLNNISQALVDLNKAILLAPDDSSNFILRANVHRHLGNLPLVELDVVRAVSLLRTQSYTLREVTLVLDGVLPIFCDEFLHPYLVKSLIVDYALISNLSYHGLVFQNQDQCQTIDRYLLYLEKVRKENIKHPFEFQSLLGLIHFYMGDPGEAFRLYNDVLDIDFTINMQGLYYLIRSASTFQEPETSQKIICDDTVKQARMHLRGFTSDSAGKEEMKELYYAGQIFFITENYKEAHQCFTRIFLQFPAAAYMQVLTLEKIGLTTEMETKIARIRHWEASSPADGLLRGFTKRTLNIEDDDFGKPIHDFALHQELIDAIQLVWQPGDKPYLAPAFWEALALSEIDFHQIRHRVLEKELVALTEEGKDLFSSPNFEQEQLTWGSNPEAVFKRLQALPIAQLEDSLVMVIGDWQLRPDEYHFFIRYFYFDQRLTLWQTFSLLLYLDARRRMNREAPEINKEVGGKTAEELIKQLLQEPATYATASAFSAAAASTVAVETTALAGIAIFLLMKAVRQLITSGRLTNKEADVDYKQFKRNFLERLYDTAEELKLNSKTIFEKYIKPVLDKELVSK